MNETALEAAIVDLVARLDYVSFAELPRRLAEAGFAESRLKGDSTLELPGNIILWCGLSAELVDAIRALLDSKRLHLHPASTLVYIIDGVALRLPVAKRLPKEGYRKSHWLPVCLRVVPVQMKKAKAV